MGSLKFYLEVYPSAYLEYLSFLFFPKKRDLVKKRCFARVFSVGFCQNKGNSVLLLCVIISLDCLICKHNSDPAGSPPCPVPLISLRDADSLIYLTGFSVDSHNTSRKFSEMTRKDLHSSKIYVKFSVIFTEASTRK